MATLLLDTSTFSLLMRKHGNAVSKLDQLPTETRVVTSVIVRGEILFGLGHLGPGKRKDALTRTADSLFQAIPNEALPTAASEHYGELKLRLRQSGHSLDENDLWIAAHALTLKAKLISHDADFKAIPGLQVESWL